VAVAARTEKVTDERFPGTIYETAEKVTAAGGKGFPVACNVADEESVNAMVSSVLERYGRIDILMNNAAAWPPSWLQTVKPRWMCLTLELSLYTPMIAWLTELWEGQWTHRRRTLRLRPVKRERIPGACRPGRNSRC
jgi:NAD(P)-dependent dehydrogenase (short-subunit alcohol dehydrogenase family)